MTRKLLLLGACAATLAALPAADAHAARTVVYDVVVEGTGKFHEIKAFDDPRPFTHVVDSTVGIRAEIPRVTFVDGRLDATASGPSIASVTATSEITAVTSDRTLHQKCESLFGLSPQAEARIVADPLQPLENAEPLIVRAADLLDTDWACTGDPLSADEGVLGMPVDEGEGPLDAQFTLPREIIGDGKIIQLVHGAPQFAHRQCPASVDDLWKCTGGWDGTVTFTKVADSGAPGPVPAAPAPATTPAAPAKPTGSALTDDDLLAPLVPRKASVDKNGTTATFKATCPTGCRGTATFTAASGKARASAARKALGTVRFSLKAGAKAQTVELKLPRKARAALKRGALKMAVALAPKGGRAKRTTLTLRRR